jgi:hypothetical protein
MHHWPKYTNTAALFERHHGNATATASPLLGNSARCITQNKRSCHKTGSKAKVPNLEQL